MFRVGIIGGGLAGLTAAYKLSRQGVTVNVFERENELGGLAGSFPLAGSYIERYYHFICANDHDILALCDEVGLRDEIAWKQAKTSFFYEGKMYAFGSPFDLLRFSPVDFPGRIRFGLNILYSRYMDEWEKLDKLPAKDWLISQIGQRAYDVIWHPLLKVKFGEYYDKISAAWMWHRIHRVATSRKKLFQGEQFAYLQRGTKSLVDRLVEKIREHGGEVLTGHAAEGLIVENGAVKGLRSGGQKLPFDAIISAVPLPSLAGLLPPEAEAYRLQVEKIDYIGVVCVLFKLKKQLSDCFWVNINDSRVSVNGIIEYSNLNPCPQFGGSAIVYVPYYLSQHEERFHYTEQQLISEYIDILHLLNPEFSPDWVEETRVFRDPYAQAICTTGFKELVLPYEAPLQNLYVIDSTQMYPSDRTISETIRLATQVSDMITKRSASLELTLARK